MWKPRPLAMLACALMLSSSPLVAGEPKAGGSLRDADQALLKDYKFPFPIRKDLGKAADTGDYTAGVSNPGSIGIYLPPGVKTLRGVVFRHALGVSPRLDEVCDLWQMAWVDGYIWADAIHGVNKGRARADQARVMELALEDWAARTGHPELRHLPFITLGGSRTGPHAIEYGQSFPGRHLAWGCVVADVRKMDAEMLKVPGINIAAEFDNLGNLLKSLEASSERQHGLHGYAAMWNQKHGGYSCHDLMLPVFDQLIRLRLPAGPAPADGKVSLRPLQRDDGWLASTEDWQTVAPAKEYKGDPKRAAWLPNKAAAMAWRAYCVKKPMLEMTEPTNRWFSGGQLEKKLHSFGYIERRNFTPKSEIVFQTAANSKAPEFRKVAFFAGDIPLGEATSEPWQVKATGVPPGLHAVYAVGTTADGAEHWSRPALIAVHGDIYAAQK